MSLKAHRCRSNRLAHGRFFTRDLFGKPSCALGMGIVLVFVLIAAIGPWLSAYGPTQMIGADARQAPSWSHWFGTDLLGRDIFSRIMYGARSILSLTGLGALLAVVAGTVIGLASGYWGGWIDEIIMRILDSLLAVPALLLALVLLGAVGQSQGSVLAVIAVVYVPIVARVVRSEVLAVKPLGYIEAARLRGENLPYMLLREILPSVLPALSVEAALRFSYGIFLVASLGYLGVGVQPPTPDWGLMVKEARSTVWLTPWALYFPAGAISLLIIGINLAADGLKSALQGTHPSGSSRARARLLKVRRQWRDAHVVDTTDEPAKPDAMLCIQHLTAAYRVQGRWIDALRDVSLEIGAGETLGVVGESGSGKSTLALAIVQYLGSNGAIRAGHLLFEAQSILDLSGHALRDVRRHAMALIPQDPMASLNPSLRVGNQIAETLRLGGRQHSGDVDHSVLELVSRVRIPDPSRVVRQMPHELSGGMQQRIVIAMALAANPRLLILDEPTTGLDVTTEAAILDLVRELLAEGERSAMYISHDLGVVARVCDRIAVLYAGELLETGRVSSVFQTPDHPYTVGLLTSIPRFSAHRAASELPSMEGNIPSLVNVPAGCVFEPRCPLATDLCLTRPQLEQLQNDHAVRCHHRQDVAGMRDSLFAKTRAHTLPRAAEPARSLLQVRNLETQFPLQRSLRELVSHTVKRSVHAVNGVSLILQPATTLGIVGESGSGKTTLVRTLLGLSLYSSGQILLGEEVVPAALSKRDRGMLRQLQFVSQDPDQALNPHLSIGTSIRRQILALAETPRSAVNEAVHELLRQVGLTPGDAVRLPSQLSGGEKQRVAIARAIAANSSLILCDEATSSLDVSVQARILNLLSRVQDARQCSMLFITHDLAVVAHVADTIAVMYLGKLMEKGSRNQVLAPPYHPYTEALLSAYPSIERNDRQAAIRLSGQIPSPVNLPTGCPFHSRCPRIIGSICQEVVPPWQRGNDGHGVACHIPLAELAMIQTMPAEFLDSHTEDGK